MIKSFLPPKFKTALAIIWLVFTFSLVFWWWLFFLIHLNPDETKSLVQLQNSHRMFAWEGSILLATIFLGGIALVTFTYRDQRRNKRLRFFFATFSHDIKTSISRLRLQSEVLEQDAKSNSNPTLKRLIADIQRLDLQLENSLLLADLENNELLNEEITLSELLSQLRNDFNELTLILEKDAIVSGDRRALLSVFRNLLQNSFLHGQASQVNFLIAEAKPGQLQIQVQDNGQGFKGNFAKLGSEILKSKNTSSNGIGLLIASRLIEKMNGKIDFLQQDGHGFSVLLQLEGHFP